MPFFRSVEHPLRTFVLILLVAMVPFGGAMAQTLRYDVTADGKVNVGDVEALARLIVQQKQNVTIDASASTPTGKTPIRILDIGNSFSADANCYLDGMVSATGVDASNVALYQLYKSGSSFNYWVENYRGKKTDNYTYYKVMGGLDLPVNGKNQVNATDKSLFHTVLTDFKWDIIIIHQSSLACYKYESWNTANSADGDLQAFLSILREHQPQARVDFLLVHAPYQIIAKAKLQTSDQLWQKIMQSASQIQRNDGIGRIIPAGTAVQNLRQTKYNDAHQLCRDDLHLGHGLARYTANCAYYETILAPILGVSVLGNTYRPTISSQDKKESTASAPIPLTDNNALVAQTAAFLATAFGWQTFDPNDYLSVLTNSDAFH